LKKTYLDPSLFGHVSRLLRAAKRGLMMGVII